MLETCSGAGRVTQVFKYDGKGRNQCQCHLHCSELPPQPTSLVTIYQLQHSSGVTVNTIHCNPGVDGVVHPIETVTSEDDGEYDCIVTVVVGSEKLQSDTIRASLIVYYGQSCKVMAMCYKYYICVAYGEYMHLDVYCSVSNYYVLLHFTSFTSIKHNKNKLVVMWLLMERPKFK